jgi:hypothetical protein
MTKVMYFDFAVLEVSRLLDPESDAIQLQRTEPRSQRHGVSAQPDSASQFSKAHEHFLILKDLQPLPTQPIHQLELSSSLIHAFQGGSAFSTWSAAHGPRPPLAPHGSLACGLAPLACGSTGWRT